MNTNKVDDRNWDDGGGLENPLELLLGPFVFIVWAIMCFTASFHKDCEERLDQLFPFPSLPPNVGLPKHDNEEADTSN